MKHSKHPITPCLWFDTEAAAAANFYVSIFPDSKLGRISRYGHEGQEIHGKKPGSVLTVEFEINRQKFVALNGGPNFKFTEATSFQVPCDSQEEIDYFWNKLGEGGEEGPCGWLKDRYSFLASLPRGGDRHAGRSRSRESGSRHEGLHEDEEIRSGGHRARL